MRVSGQSVRVQAEGGGVRGGGRLRGGRAVRGRPALRLHTELLRAALVGGEQGAGAQLPHQPGLHGLHSGLQGR